MQIADSIQKTWTDRDFDIIETLALRARILTLEQITELWWKQQERETAYKRLHRLCKAGFLNRYRINAHPLLDLHRPVFSWRPGESPPNDEAVSVRLRIRWREPSISHSVYIATKKTVNLFASYAPGKLGRFHDWTHDLHIGQVYIHYKEQYPQEFAEWVGEDSLSKAGDHIKDPDAFICIGAKFANDSLLKIVEFGGSYDAKRIRDFHKHCTGQLNHLGQLGVPYEIW